MTQRNCFFPVSASCIQKELIKWLTRGELPEVAGVTFIGTEMRTAELQGFAGSRYGLEQRGGYLTRSARPHENHGTMGREYL